MATPRNVSFFAPSGATVRMGFGVGVAPPPPAQIAPTITLQPSNATVTEPTGATFTAAASGSPAPTLQWQQTTPPGSTFADVPGATAGTYTISPTEDTADNGRQVRARFTNGAGTVTSNAATLTVNAATAPPPIPAGGIPQYLTSDGGTAGVGSNYSGPTRDKWHNRLGFAWVRPNTLGNWLDSAQVPEGSTPYASSAAITSAGQRVSIAATALVARWLASGQNRGAYLRVNSGSLFPVLFRGRTDPTPALRPTLTVVTSLGTTTLTALCNAWWQISSFQAAGSALEWRLSSGQAPAILRFDLSSIAGTLTSATLEFSVKSFPDGGSTGQVVGLFEADPPAIIDPVSVLAPTPGLLTGYSTFAAFKNAGLASVLLADDFESPGPFDSGFTPAATRTLNTATGTTYARGTIQGGGAPGSGTSSLDNNKSVTAGTGPRGAPDIVRPELFGHYAWYMEATFGTTQDDAIKIPAMGVQFGVWNPVGYWQQTTGNGGSRGTGLKVDNGGSTNFEYQGHSIRLLTGTAPKAGDDDPYTGWFGVGVYPYNLDQVQDFPDGEAVPYVALRREAWYDIDIRVKQNTVSGTQDSLGNWSVANPDGVYQIWINGYLAYSKTTFRWRRHLEFGVQGLWLDVYHGGQSPALVDMHYRVDRVAVATQYIGPSALILPAWVPAPGNLTTMTVANGRLANQWRDVIDPYYNAFYAVKAVNDYSGAFPNPWWGTHGGIVFFGGGHAGTNYNGTIVAELGPSGITYKRANNATPWFGTGTDSTTQDNNGGSTATNALTNLDYMESTIDGKPGSPHSYGSGDVVGPDFGGAANGTFLRVVTSAVNRVNDAGTVAAHQLPFTTTAGNGGAGNWARVTNTFIAPGTNWQAPQLTAFVGPQQRVYIQTNNSVSNVRWFDRSLNNWVTGTGTTFGYDEADGFDSGTMFYVPSRGLLVCMYPVSNTLRVQWMDVTVAQPTLGGTATLSSAIAVSNPWSAGCWCQDNNRIIVGKAGQSGAFEIAIPAVLTNPWPVEYAAFGNGGTIPFEGAGEGGNTYKKWSYLPSVKAIVYQRFATYDAADVVHVYRPRNT